MYLFISPHLDDIIFSLGDFILNTNNKIMIVTIFTKKNNDKLKKLPKEYYAYGDYDVRLKEDTLAMINLNKDIVVKYLDFEDQIFRESDNNILNKIESKLNDILNENIISRIYIPLGIGLHPDHIITFNACYNIKHDNKIYYYDFPYYSIKLNTKVRLSQFGIFEKFLNLCDVLEYYNDPINESCHFILRGLKILYFCLIYIFNYFFIVKKNNIQMFFRKINVDNKYKLALNYQSQIKPIFGSSLYLLKKLEKYDSERIIKF